MLGASEAWVRRLLISQQLFGIKVGRVWGVYEEDLKSFMRVRRGPGRPPKTAAQERREWQTRRRIDADTAAAGTHAARLKARRK